MPTQPSRKLETFPNPAPARDFRIHMEIPEFTCLCPKTGQPDFATLILDYVPDKRCIELKSLKLYIWSFRNEGAFHEAVTNRILDDLARATKPRYMHLTARFYVRGGIFTTISAQHMQRGFKPADMPELPLLAPGSPVR
jgi:7-cyano-7-deazaguanine reductase